MKSFLIFQQIITIITLFMFSLLFTNLYAQQDSLKRINMQQSTYNDKPIPQEITSYFKLLRNYSSKSEIEAAMDTISLKELKKIAKKMYEVSEKDAEAAQLVLITECKIADSLDYLKRKYKKDIQLFSKPTLTEKYIYQKILDRLSKNVYATIYADYLLKVTIKSINRVKHEDTNYKEGYTEPPQTFIEVNAIIDEIVKGHTRFSIGEEIVFIYHPYWRKDNNFLVGEVCFVPLEARVDPDWKINHIALFTTLDSSYGRYPIINNELIDKDNFFGYGSKITWNDFRNNLLQLITTIKKW